MRQSGLNYLLGEGKLHSLCNCLAVVILGYAVCHGKSVGLAFGEFTCKDPLVTVTFGIPIALNCVAVTSFVALDSFKLSGE